jgi:hypothetical protein
MIALELRSTAGIHWPMSTTELRCSEKSRSAFDRLTMPSKAAWNEKKNIKKILDLTPPTNHNSALTEDKGGSLLSNRLYSLTEILMPRGRKEGRHL